MIPCHIRIPFRVVRGRAHVDEQDSTEEIIQCVETVLSTPQGWRVELLEFGLPDPLFKVQAKPTDITAYVKTIERWEPRASPIVRSAPGLIDELVAKVTVTLRARSHE